MDGFSESTGTSRVSEGRTTAPDLTGRPGLESALGRDRTRDGDLPAGLATNRLSGGVGGSGMAELQRKPDDRRGGVQEQGAGMVDQARETAGQVMDQAQEKTGQLMGTVKQQASARLTGQVERATEGLNGASRAMAAVSQQLREQNQEMLAGYADQAAGQVRRAAGYLQGKDVEQLLTETERFARRQPMVFVGGAFTLGLLAARFLKTSGSQAFSGNTSSLSSGGGLQYPTAPGAAGSGMTGGSGSTGRLLAGGPTGSGPML